MIWKQSQEHVKIGQVTPLGPEGIGGTNTGVDIGHNKDRRVRCNESKCKDIFLNMLVELHRFLAIRTNSTFKQVVLKRLFMNCTNRPPLSLSQVIRKRKLSSHKGNTSVVVGTITDDMPDQDVPKLKVCALQCEQPAWSHILKAEDQILTFRQVALDSPMGCGLVLLSDPAKAKRCTGILVRPRKPLTATPSPAYTPWAGSTTMWEANWPATAAKTNRKYSQ